MEETLYFNLEQGHEMEIHNAKSILLQIGMEMQDLTTNEFYDNGNLAINIAALLGVDPARIKVVNVIREDSTGRRRRSGSEEGKIVLEIADEPVASTPVRTLPPEVDDSAALSEPPVLEEGQEAPKEDIMEEPAE